MSNNLLLRTLSAIVIGLLFITAIIWFPTLYYILILLIGLLMAIEWHGMTKSTKYLKYGFIIIPFPIASLIYLNHLTSNYAITLMYFFSIWSVDTFAMFGGKTFGGFKLAPKISPNKTWSGLILGCIASGIACYIISRIFYIYKFPVAFFTYGLINGVVSQISDIFISYFKRKCNVKDSGNLIPGHGGVLDRFDSIIFSAPLLLLLISL